jgi:hypothetical protein
MMRSRTAEARAAASARLAGRRDVLPADVSSSVI